MLRASRPLARTVVLATALAVHAAGPASAQGTQPGTQPARPASPATTSPATTAPAPANQPPTNPVVARVDGQDIRMSDISEAAQGLPDQLRGMPPQMLFPMLLDQLIDRRTLAVQARKAGLEKQEDVRRAMDAAADRALQAAYVSREIGPQVSEAAIRARYDSEIAGKPGAEEVHARHILVADEATAKKVIEELKKGGNFADLAKKYSTDPGGAQGGDLGFFKKDDMVPEFAAAAFALKPGEITLVPVKSQFGWHVIKLEERRAAPPPSFEEARDELRQKMIQEAYQKLSAAARAEAKVERFNMDGSVPRATDTAEPPPPTRR